jgi:hypothetical protein
VKYLDGVTGAGLDWQEYLRSYGDILATPGGRRAASRLDPLLFSLLYFRRHLTDKPTDTITFADLHLDMCRRARQWARTNVAQQEIRDAWVAWRESGKSTWNFLILPTWALAHHHREYALAFAASGPQAEQHLMTFKMEMQQNAMLRKDHPTLTTPGKNKSGQTLSDTKSMYISARGSVFQARGIDSASLGLKVGDVRPDLMLLDDIEPEESNYSEYQKEKRLHTVQSAIFPMNLRAVVSLTGTVTMAGSVVHDIVLPAQRPNSEDLPAWPRDENFRVRYYPMMIEEDEGPRSAHETRFPVEWMTRIPEGASRRVCDTASFKLNYQNDARGKTGGWWEENDFRYETMGHEATRWILQLDPAVTETTNSDYTALTVTAFSPELGKVEIVYARQVKMVGEPLRRLVINLLERFPRIKVVRVEVNQGHDLWKTALRGLPVPLDLHTSEIPKRVRIAYSLDWYQRGRVLHTERLDQLEGYQLNYPEGLHDDLPDGAALGILYFLGIPTLVSVDRKDKSYT